MRALALKLFLHHEMRCGLRRHLRQMRDAKHLVAAPQLAHARPNLHRDFATDVGVDLIEDQQRHGVVLRQYALHRKHHARDLAARRDRAQRLGRLAGIRREQKLHRLQPARARGKDKLRRLEALRAGLGKLRQPDFKFRFLETQLPQLRPDVGGQLRRGLRAQGTELATGFS